MFPVVAPEDVASKTEFPPNPPLVVVEVPEAPAAPTVTHN
jgi:hypothetical protein